MAQYSGLVVKISLAKNYLPELADSIETDQGVLLNDATIQGRCLSAMVKRPEIPSLTAFTTSVKVEVGRHLPDQENNTTRAN
jgi:hypothetical protein